MTPLAAFAGEARSPSSDIAFGNLVDLLRMQADASAAAVCEACSTINFGPAELCKCCSRKLPASYLPSASRQRPPQSGPWRGLSRRAWAMVLTAFWGVIHSLVFITTIVPIT